MSDIRIVQLTDENRELITPYTSASAVYMRIGDECVSVEKQLGAMNVNAVVDAQSDALDDIDALREESLEKIDYESDAYNRPLDKLSDMINKIDEAVYPLVASVTLTPNVSTMMYSYKYTVTEYGSGATGANVSVTKDSNGTVAQLYSGTASTMTLSTTVSWGRDVFSLSAQKAENGKSVSDSKTRYLCAYGNGGSQINASMITDTLAKVSTSSSSFQATVNTTLQNKYIWICVPSYISVNKVTSGGFDVTMDRPKEVSVGPQGVTYKCYRTLNELQVTTWKLVIS